MGFCFRNTGLAALVAIGISGCYDSRIDAQKVLDYLELEGTHQTIKSSENVFHRIDHLELEDGTELRRFFYVERNSSTLSFYECKIDLHVNVPNEERYTINFQGSCSGSVTLVRESYGGNVCEKSNDTPENEDCWEVRKAARRILPDLVRKLKL